MSGEQGAQALYLVGFLVIVLTGLVARRIPFVRGLLMAASWVAIFGLAYLVIAGGGLERAGGQLTTLLSGKPQVVGDTVRIPMSPDGHFYVTARVNGEPIRLLIDSGATVTSFSSDVALRADIDAEGGYRVPVRTANGVVTARRTRAEEIEVETIKVEDMAVLVSDSFGVDGVLGMNFLSRLRRWGVEGRWMVLEP